MRRGKISSLFEMASDEELKEVEKILGQSLDNKQERMETKKREAAAKTLGIPYEEIEKISEEELNKLIEGN